MITTLPLTVTPEAQEHIREMGIEKPYQKMLEHIPVHYPDALAVTVEYAPQYDAGGDGWVVFQVGRPGPFDSDAKDREWRAWTIEELSPDEFIHFGLDSTYLK